jgi:hypothetical protein
MKDNMSAFPHLETRELRMKHIITTLLLTISLVACSIPPIVSAQATSKTATAPVITQTMPLASPTRTSTNTTIEEAAVRDLVENFGKRLQDVSLLSPDVVQEMQNQYAEFVSPALLETWTSDISSAPGRIVSSPWPDRIEITTLTKSGSDKYVITGFVIEVTSVEVVNGGAASRIPVHLVVQKSQGDWLITEYAQER